MVLLQNIRISFLQEEVRFANVSDWPAGRGRGGNGCVLGGLPFYFVLGPPSHHDLLRRYAVRAHRNWRSAVLLGGSLPNRDSWALFGALDKAEAFWEHHVSEDRPKLEVSGLALLVRGLRL